MHAIVTTAMVSWVLGLMVGPSSSPSAPAAVIVAPRVHVATASDSLRAESALQATLLRPQLEVYF